MHSQLCSQMLANGARKERHQKGDSKRALHDGQRATATFRDGNIQSHLANTQTKERELTTFFRGSRPICSASALVNATGAPVWCTPPSDRSSKSIGIHISAAPTRQEQSAVSCKGCIVQRLYRAPPLQIIACKRVCTAPVPSARRVFSFCAHTVALGDGCHVTHAR